LLILCRHEGINRNVYYRWSKTRAYLSGKRSDGLIFTALLSTTGYSVTRITELTALRIENLPRRWPGTRFRWITAMPSLNWPWTSQSSRRERWHRSMKNQILLNNSYLPAELQEHLQRFISYYNHERYHESLDNLTPADVYYGRRQEVLDQREIVKLNTLAMRRKIHYDNRNNLTLMS
jgi:hypothetical protein